MPSLTAAEVKRLQRRAVVPVPPKPAYELLACERHGLRLRLEIPFSMHLLKNHAHTLKRHLTPAARAAREAVIQAVQMARIPGPRRRWPERKTWLEIDVWKPDHRPDAINVLDGLADAIKLALGIDDRWFSVRRLDWSIDRLEPRIQLVIEADTWEDQVVCRQCGAITEEGARGGRCAACATR